VRGTRKRAATSRARGFRARCRHRRGAERGRHDGAPARPRALRGGPSACDRTIADLHPATASQRKVRSRGVGPTAMVETDAALFRARGYEDRVHGRVCDVRSGAPVSRMANRPPRARAPCANTARDRLGDPAGARGWYRCAGTPSSASPAASSRTRSWSCCARREAASDIRRPRGRTRRPAPETGRGQEAAVPPPPCAKPSGIGAQILTRPWRSPRGIARACQRRGSSSDSPGVRPPKSIGYEGVSARAPDILRAVRRDEGSREGRFVSVGDLL
jgi:hypothetical protein